MKKGNFSERPNQGKIEEILNQHIEPKKVTSANDKIKAVECKIEPFAGQLLEPFKYMYQTIAKKIQILEDRIDSCVEVISEHYNKETLCDPTIVVGKICCDSEGRLNPESAMLVTSINLGERVIKLFLNDLPSFSLFPGQIIGVEGVNNTGNCLYVKKIYELPLLPFYRSPNQINENDQTLIINDYSSSSSSSKSLEVVFVAGPYTLDTDLTFEPFKELIRKMIKEKPNILVLMGPFVDENHPIIQQGKATMLVDDIFNNNITKYLDVLIKDSPDINVIVIPNPRDVIHEYPIFPQPPFNNRFSKNTITLPNPAQFRVNDEITFAINNVDILFHLSVNETSGNCDSDRMGRLAKHILTQRHLYPLFPPVINDINLDVKNSSSLQLQATPDVLVTPSKLKFFAKIINNVICINPGYVSKNQSNGTYAKLTIHPPQQNNSEPEQFISKRSRVEIIRL
ncbi:16934_t:CDS:10 [Entrophospora sp. SA101]|nr:14131_t:CDS:10 [Entrophospora sp. SA101]CAJ0759178.1 16934_t:CDS:10 [Entrophospora sp. SA101]CAJ0841728.1 16160_t:CDS:10 [Entrophospora sp. SA101]